MEERLTTQQLLELAAEAGFEVSERRLEDWRYRGLLPRPERAGNVGKTPRWLYPPGTDEQLLDLCRWRAKTKDLDAIRLALWIDGHPFEPDEVRSSISAALKTMQRRFEQALADEASRNGDDELTSDEALDRLAYRAAGIKGDKPTPRTIRMLRAERARGIAFITRLFMGYDLEAHMADAKEAERAMGTSAGRRGAEPYRWLSGASEELAELQPVFGLPTLIETIQTATREELDQARALTRTFVQGLPLVALFAEAMFGPRAGGLSGAKNILGAGPELYCFLVPACVAGLRNGFAENFSTVASSLGDINALAPVLDELAALPASDRARRIEDTPPEQRPQLRRLIDLTRQEQQQGADKTQG